MRATLSPTIMICLLTACSVCGAQVAIPEGFPAAATTGIAGAGLTVEDLTATEGRRITVDGAVIDREDVAGQLYIFADNVTIRRCRITSSSNYGVRIEGGYTGTVIEDCLLVGTGGAANVTGAHYTLRRCDLSGDHDGLKLNTGVLVEDCYIHDQFKEEGTHNDCMQDSGSSSGWIVRHNTILGPYQQTNAALQMSTNLGAIDNVLIEGNFLSGGGFTVQCRDNDDGFGPPTHVTFRNNVFEAGSSIHGHIAFDGAPYFEGNIFHTGEPIPENPLVNLPPVADAGRDQAVTDDDGDGAESLTLDGSGSHDVDGTIGSYVWSENLLELGTGVRPTLPFDVGSHSVDLAVTDDDGATDTDSLVVLVKPAVGNQYPLADAGADQTVPDADEDGAEAITLDGTASFDPDGSIVSYAWQENADLLAATAVATVALEVGVHPVVLTVTDDAGATDIDTVVITVEAPSLANTYAIYAQTADCVVRDDGSFKPAGSTDFRIGGGRAGADGAAVIPFRLPALDPEEVVVSATLEINLIQIRPGVDFNVDLYGLPYRALQNVLVDDFYEGPFGGDDDAVALQDDLLTPATPVGLRSSTAEATLAAYVNDQVAAGAGDGDFIFLRLSPDIMDAGDFVYYTVTSADGAPGPTLTLVTGPRNQAGDADGDGDVDLDDFSILKVHFGRTGVTAGSAEGDFDGDGDVDLDDFSILKLHFGTTP